MRGRWPVVCLFAGAVAVAGLAAANDDPARSSAEDEAVARGPSGLAAGAEASFPRATSSNPPLEAGPASPAAGRILTVLGEVARSVRVTRYQHNTVVRPRSGVFLWDCSGMAAWVVGRAAPAARAAIQSSRPVARDFFGAIARAPVERPRRGWQRLERLADARPGDVFAWLRPPDWPRRNTGHVGFILEPPSPVPGLPGAWAVRISDATSIPHQADSRTWPGDGGFGVGTLMFMTDAGGAPTHYGWHGTRAGFTAETRIVVGRVTR
ncbi:MAG: hypothetical protein HYY06_30185 [Deltaproteobacteria bacterium]|nr:hypothetical protein [Deltaproteobacteria bacterium]